MKKWMKRLVVGLSASFVLASSHLAPIGVSAQEYDDTINIGTTNTMNSLNPVNTSDVVGQFILRFMYGTLVDQPEAGKFQPNLAEITTEDNLTFTVTVLPDANWSDGTPITAEDVAYTVQLISDPAIETHEGAFVAAIKGLDDAGKREEGVDTVEGIKLVDDKTLEVTLKEPTDIAFFNENFGFKVYIVPKHVVEALDVYNLGSTAIATNPTVFSGPYKFVKYENGAYVQLVANESYHRGKPKTENIFVQFMDSTALVTALQSGDIDMSAGGGIGVIPITDINALRENEALFVEGNVGTSLQFLFFNDDLYPDARVRKAFAKAINRERLVADLLQGEGEVPATSYTSINPYVDKDLEPEAYDPEGAKALLEEADFDFSREIVLSVPSGNQTRMMSAALIEQDLEAIGLTVSQVTSDFATHLAAMNEDKFDIGLMGLALNIDPDQSSYFGPASSSKYSRIDDPTFIELMNKGKALTSFEERLPVYKELQAYVKEQAFFVPTYSDKQFIVQNKKLTGGIKAFWLGSLYDLETWTLEK